MPHTAALPVARTDADAAIAAHQMARDEFRETAAFYERKRRGAWQGAEGQAIRAAFEGETAKLVQACSATPAGLLALSKYLADLASAH